MSLPVPPAITSYRNQPRVASRMQDATISNSVAVNQALSQASSSIVAVQDAVGPGTIASGVLVLAVMPATGTYTLVPHNLGRVASGFLVVGKSITVDVFQDFQDPGCPATSGSSASRRSSQPTKNNPTPTKTIRLQSTAGSPTEVALWVF